jgi:hypothetical protein
MQDVVSGWPSEGKDATCLYLPADLAERQPY